MLPRIVTRRTLLRPISLDDVEALHALWNAPEVRRWLWDDAVISREMAETVVKEHLVTAARYHIGYWALHIPPQIRDDGVVDGFCGFRFFDSGTEIELLFGLRGEHWGKRFATEACGAALGHLWSATRFSASMREPTRPIGSRCG